MYRIGIDAMGLSKGIGSVIDSLVYFLEDHSDVEFIVFGKRSKLKELEGVVKVVDCLEVVDPNQDIEEIIKNNDLSMNKLLEHAKEKKVDAIVSGANSRVFLGATIKKLELFEEIKEPALANLLPTNEEGESVCLLDCGFSEKRTSQRLYMLSRMGRVLAQVEKGMPTPRISLLKTRYDNFKYNNDNLKAIKYIEEQELPGFKGAVESRHIFSNEYSDVVVCGGLEGEMLVSTTEGTAKLFVNTLRKSFSQNFSSKVGYFIAKSSLEPLKNNVDYKNFSGSLLLGFDSIVVKAPQDSDTVAFYHSVKLAYQMCRKKLINKMRSEFF